MLKRAQAVLSRKEDWRETALANENPTPWKRNLNFKGEGYGTKAKGRIKSKNWRQVPSVWEATKGKRTTTGGHESPACTKETRGGKAKKEKVGTCKIGKKRRMLIKDGIRWVTLAKDKNKQ